MKRRLLDVLTSMSLLLCVAVVALWVRSYWVGDGYWRSWFFDEGGRTHWVQESLLAGRGGIAVRRVVTSGPAGVGFREAMEREITRAGGTTGYLSFTPSYPLTPRDAERAFLGFGFHRYSAVRPGNGRVEQLGTHVLVRRGAALAPAWGAKRPAAFNSIPTP